MEVSDSPDENASLLAHGVATLPPDFEAFYALHYQSYLGYATVHLGDARGREAVQEAFGMLASSWSQVLSLPDPTAHAWQAFTERTRVHSTRPDARTPCPVTRLLGPLSNVQHDAVVLHYLLDQPLTETALVMGEDPGRMPSLLREALRR